FRYGPRWPIRAATRSPLRRGRRSPELRSWPRSSCRVCSSLPERSPDQRLERRQGLVEVVDRVDASLFRLRQVRLRVCDLDGVRRSEAEPLLCQPQLLGGACHYLFLQPRGLIGGLEVPHRRRDLLSEAQALFAHAMTRVRRCCLGLVDLKLAAETDRKSTRLNSS